MSRKKSEIKTTFDQLNVTASKHMAGADVFDNSWLRGKTCQVLATFIHRYEDDSTVPVFIVQDTDDSIKLIACERCAVVKDVTDQDFIYHNNNCNPRSDGRVEN